MREHFSKMKHKLRNIVRNRRFWGLLLCLGLLIAGMAASSAACVISACVLLACICCDRFVRPRAAAWIERRRALSPAWALRFLQKRGLNPTEDKDGDLRFRIGDLHYLLRFRERFFQLYTDFGRKPSELNDQMLMTAAQVVMASTQMIKILSLPQAIIFSIECRQSRKSEFAAFFDSYICILEFAVTEHRRLYNEALEGLNQQLRRQREEEELSRRFSDYQGKEVIN